jgi:segregation and condensation protein A
MSTVVPFEEDPPHRDAAGNPERLVVDLGGFEGPIDVLLQLARDQKVDITQLSILALAEQYLAFIREARRLRLELAADYLVMAAWLAFLKSRLLLPEPEEDGAEEPSGAEMAAALRFQLQRLQAMQDAGQKLLARPQLGQQVFARGEPTEIPVVHRPRYECSFYELLQAYARQKAGPAAESLRVDPGDLFSVEDALDRLRRRLGHVPDWSTLAAFLPAGVTGLQRRSATAATLAASLELVRDGKAELRQDSTFGPIYLRPRTPSDGDGEADGAPAEPAGPQR